MATLAMIVGGVNCAWAQYTVNDLTSAGWTQVTELSDVSSNYYVFLDSSTDFMLGLNKSGVNTSASDGNRALFYKDLADPSVDLTKVFFIETSGDYYCIRNIEFDKFVLNTWYQQTQYYMTQDIKEAGNDNWPKLSFSCKDGSWTLYSVQKNNYLGPISSVADGVEIVAGNADEAAGHYRIFQISKSDFSKLYLKNYSGSNLDATILITNNAFERASKTGWTCTAGNVREGGYEIWHANNSSVSQTLHVLNGKYTVTCQALHGEGESANSLLFAKSGDNEQTAQSSEATTTTGSTAFGTETGRIIADANLGKISVDIMVNNGSLQLGFKQTAASQWDVFGNFTLSYVDPYVSALSTTFTSGGIMEAGQWYSFTVSTDGDYTLSATDGIVYTVEDALVSQAQTATSTVALKAGTAYFKSATSQPLTITYVNPVVENGTYFLYDETNKVFLSRGNSYGTEASLDLYGVPFVYNNYEKTIRFVDDLTNGLFTNTNNDFFTDGTPAKWAFEETEGGLYLRDGAKTKYVKKASSSYGGEVLKYTDVATEAIVWTLKSKTEHDAIIADYPTNNKTNVITSASLSDDTDAEGFETWLAENRAAKDMTARVGTAKFAGSVGDWTWNETNRKRDDQPAYGTDFAELFSVTGNFTQTIEGLAEGVYKVTINAFEREKGYADCNTLGAAGWEIVTAYFEANGEKVQLKSWYSEKEGTSNPNNTTEAATAFNNDKYKNVVFAYVGSDEKLTLKLAKPSYIWDSWVLFNNVTLTYYDSNVSDEDATAILDEANTQMEKPMKHSLYAALNTAKATFDGARTVPNYNALRQAIDNTATSVASYASMYNNYLLPISNIISTTNFVDKSSSAYVSYQGYKDAYDNYTDDNCVDVENATANGLTIEYVKNTGTHGSLLLPNWKLGNTVATTNGCGLYINWWSTENEGTGDAKDFSNPFFEYYVPDAEVLSANTITGTLTGLKANQAYSVTANVRVRQTDNKTKVAESITMEVVGGEKVDVTSGNQIGETARYINSYTATGVTDAEGNLELKFTVAANSNINWLSFRDVNYAESNATISNDFSVLESAINTVESNHKLGFETGEYAPYTNLAGLEAIATAKAFDKTRYYIPTVITAAANAVGNATWTQNSEEMNAIYWDYSTMASTEKSKAYGWYDPALSGNAEGSMYSTRVFNHVDKNDGLSAVNNNVALFTKISTNYGKEVGYTLPLKANRTYKLSFKFAGWTEPSESTISITDENGENPINISGVITVSGVKIEGGANDEMPSNGNKYASVWANYEGYFTVPTDGNYILNINRINMGGNVQRQLVMGNIDLRTAEALEFADGAVPTYAPGTYPAVKISRTLTADRWATAVYPFAVNTGVDDIAVLDSYDKETATLGFTTATSSEANVPFLMRSKDGATEISLNNVEVAAASATNAVASEAKLIGTYSELTIDNSAKNYVLVNNKIRPVGSNVKVAPYRAYIQVDQPGEARALSFFIDGETTTAIEGISVENERGDIYNLNGQRVNKAQKGLYIQNGKKVVLK